MCALLAEYKFYNNVRNGEQNIQLYNIIEHQLMWTSSHAQVIKYCRFLRSYYVAQYIIQSTEQVG